MLTLIARHILNAYLYSNSYSHKRYELDNIVYCLNSPDLFLSVFGTETIIYNNGSIDISDIF